MTFLSDFKKKKKKGSVFYSVITIPMVLFVFAIISIMGYYMFVEITDAQLTVFNDTGFYDPSMEEVVNDFDRSYRFLDWAMLMILVALNIGLVITSFKVKSHPVFVVILMFLAPLMGFISYYLNYVFSEFVSQEVFNTAIATFPKTMIIGTNLHWIALMAIVIAGISLFAKKPDDDFGRVGGTQE